MALDLYQHDPHPASNLGLQLRLPVDKIPAGQYSRLDNALPLIEGELTTRAGCRALLQLPDSPLHSIYRLNQTFASQISSARFLGAAGTLYAQQLPSGTITSLITGFDLRPLSMIDFRFDFDPASWLIIGNSAQMYKVRAAVASGITPNYLVYPLGEAPPNLPATATAGGTGLLNNGSGPGYDWRYTYVNSIINTESNPSPIDLAGGAGNQSPTAWQTPADVTPAINLLVPPKAQPWAFTGGINLAYNYGLNDGTSPVQYPYVLIPGQSIQIQYVSGTVKCSDARPHVNAAGQASFITDSLPGSTGTGFPTRYMPGSTLGLGGLCGAFTDSTGQVIQPLSIGLGGTFIVPAGATRLQLGIDDDRYVDNVDSGFTISVAGVPSSAVTNPGDAIDGNPATFMQATCTAFPPTAQSVRYFGFPSVGTITGLQLNVDFEVGSTGSLASSSATALSILYSFDNGVTWTTMWSGNQSSTVTRNTITTSFAVGVDLGSLQVRISAAGDGASGDTFTQFFKVYEIYTSDSEGAATTLALTNQSANVCVGIPGPLFGQDTIRLYRRGGSLVDSWYKVGDFVISTLSQGPCGSGYLLINDNVPDNELTDAIQLDNDMPVTGITNLNTPLSSIWGQFDRRVLGVGDPSRPDAVYFSKQGNADAWPPGNWVTVSTPTDPMQAGCVYNTRCFAFSHERMYELVPGLVAGVTFSPFPTPTSRGLISPWGLCTYDKIYFVSKDGVYATTGGPEQSIVENDLKPIFPTKDSPGVQVEDYEPVDMTTPSQIRLAAHNDEIYFTYRGGTTGTLQQMIYDIRKNRWRPARYNPSMFATYSEPATTSSLLLGGGDGSLYQAAEGSDNGVPVAVTIRTGSHDQGIPLSQKEYGNVVFDIDPGGADDTNPVVITPYINGESAAEAAITVTGSGRQQVPLPLGDIFAYNLEFQITWTRLDDTPGTSGGPAPSTPPIPGIDPILYQYDILWRAEPTQLTHWETRENSYGLAGYGHLRDGYLGLRSNSSTTLSFYFDGAATPGATITFPSTGGLRRKLPFALPANKWKTLRLVFDSVDLTPYRLYEGDSEFRIKQWLTPLGYRNLPMLGAESQMVQSTYSSMILGEGRGGQ